LEKLEQLETKIILARLQVLDLINANPLRSGASDRTTTTTPAIGGGRRSDCPIGGTKPNTPGAATARGAGTRECTNVFFRLLICFRRNACCAPHHFQGVPMRMQQSLGADFRLI